MKIKYLIILFIHISISTLAQVSLPKVFSSHMVLQRNIEIPVWGFANPGTEVIIEFDNIQTKVKTNEKGKWMIHLPKYQAGGPYTLTVFDSKKPDTKIVLNDILIGDVWLASGQSNMEWQVQQANNAKAEIANANFPNIRFFFVPHQKSVKPEQDISGGEWNICDSTTVKTASAVAYYFARQLHREMNVPIGILQSTWGGTPVEAWTSKEMLLSSSISKNKVIANDTVTPNHFVKDSLDLIRFWDIVYHPKKDIEKAVSQYSYNDSKWSELTMPSLMKDWGTTPYEGMVWLRKTIDLPANYSGKELTLHLGHPEMNYSLYFNGQEICKNVWNANLTHFYSIPAKLIKKGKNILTVRMAALWGGGGFNPPADEMYISDGNTKIGIDGKWKYKKDLEPSIPKIYNYHYYPTFLYNSMINPIIPYGIKGFIWYQGEANDSLAYNYRTLFPMMINDWRVRWQQGYLPFLYVQLANYKKPQTDPMESEWAELREAQTMTLSQPNTGMACIIDIGEEKTIHPLNKQEVGHRLALLADKISYGKNIVASGPMLKDFRVEGNKIIISFNEYGQNLKTSDNNAPREFTIAGNDKKFHRATAQIVENKVIVSSDEVTIPVAVRYAWADNPDCNLINGEKLPTVPFRTDNWKELTEK